MIRREDLGDGIALLVFSSDGPVNTLDRAGNLRFAELVETLVADTAVKGVVLTSDKREFLAGGDLDELRAVRMPQDAVSIVGAVPEGDPQDGNQRQAVRRGAEWHGAGRRL